MRLQSMPGLSLTDLAAQAPLLFDDASATARDMMRTVGVDSMIASVLETGSIGWWLVVIGASLSLAIILASMVLLCLGHLAKRFIQQHDTEIVGTDVTIGRLEINPFFLRFRLKDLRVFNPTGTTYLSEHMLSAEYLELKVDMWTFLWSRGKRVVVQRLAIINMQALIEKHTVRTSNVKELLDHLGNEASSSLQKIEECSQSTGGTVVLRELMFKGISVKLQVEGTSCGFGERRLLAAHTLALDDIVYADFATQVGSTDPNQLIKVLLRNFLKSILEDVSGRALSGTWF